MQMRKTKSIFFLIILMLSAEGRAGSLEAQPQPKDRGIAAVVNGVNISEAEVQTTVSSEMSRGIFHGNSLRNREKQERFRKLVIEKLIEKELVHQEAKRIGVSVKKSEVEEIFNGEMATFRTRRDFYDSLEKRGMDEDSYKVHIEKELLIKKALKQEVEDKSKVADGEIEKYYEENRRKFVMPEKVRLRDIFIKIPAAASADEKNEKMKIAEDLGKRAVAGEDFAKLAAEFSEDAYKDKGGDTGYIHLNMLEDEIAKEIAKLKPGEISKVIRNIYGIYVFKLEEREPERQRSFEEVKDRLMLEYPLEKAKKIRNAFVDGLKAKAKIETY